MTLRAGLVCLSLLWIGCGDSSSTIPETPEASTNQDPSIPETPEVSTSQDPLVAQDITVLYPYPATTTELAKLVNATATGERGDLIPADVFALLPPVVSHPAPRTNSRAGASQQAENKP